MKIFLIVGLHDQYIQVATNFSSRILFGSTRMTRFFCALLGFSLLAISVAGCGPTSESTVVDPTLMTPEQQAQQDAYVDEMNGPPPD